MKKPVALVLGSGSREHSVVESVARSANVFWYPGNGITGVVGLRPLIKPGHTPLVTNPMEMLGLAGYVNADLTFVGPEAPLDAGIADQFAAAGSLLLGPTRAAARLETSKVFAKEFMRRHNILTADFRVFEDADEALAYVRNRNCSLVVKADGLADGKGVYVCDDAQQAQRAVLELMVEKVHGKAGERIVIEEKLNGEECSFFVLCDGTVAIEFGTAGDHKRAFDGDLGPNTGGMGAFAPHPAMAR